MGNIDPGKKREYERAYREKNKVKYKAQKRIWDKKYNATHKEEIKKQREKYYQKNKESIKQRVSSYSKENATRIKVYQKDHYEKTRLGVLSKIDPAMKCSMCGCNDTRFLEINHIKGGGRKEQQGFKERGHVSSQNIVELIHKGKRGVEDLNLLCRVCNSIDHLERVYGKTGLRTVWDKEKSSKWKI